MPQERDDRVLGINTAARNTSLNAWIVEWWDRYRADWVLNTQEDYERAINSHIAPYIGRLKMVELTTPRLAQFRDDLRADDVAASDVASTLRVLSSCLGKAVERGLLTGGNPWTLGQATPRTLRASFVSLLARAGRPDAEIADETGHSIRSCDATIWASSSR